MNNIDITYSMCYNNCKGCEEMKESILIDKSVLFASRIVKLHEYLIKNRKGLTVAKQIIRSGTSIGANINEASYGQSTADFISKMHIALKETAETEYWLKLLHLSECIDDKMFYSLHEDCLELKRILVASINTAKANRNKPSLKKTCAKS